MRWITDLSPLRFALLVVGLFLLATAWAYSLGTSRPPADEVWTPATAAPPVTVTIPRVVP